MNDGDAVGSIPSDAESPDLTQRAELGAFDPPASYAFEPELQSPTPRPMPSEFSEGRLERGRHRAFTGFLVTGGLLVGVSALPVVELLALYLLPLAYLVWIGIGCLVIAIISKFITSLQRGPYRYVEFGHPIVVRIDELVLHPTTYYNGQPSAYRFMAQVSYEDPETQMITAATCQSRELNGMAKDSLTTTYRVGDYATALYMPDKLEQTLQLYGFLGLKPGLGLVRKDGASASSIWQVIAIVLFLGGLFAALIGAIYVFERYEPVTWNMVETAWVFGIGAVGLGGLLMLGLYYNQRGERRKLEQHNREAQAAGLPVDLTSTSSTPRGVRGVLGTIVVALGLLFMSGLISVALFLGLNAGLDRQPREPRPVVITNMIMTTYNFVFRNYSIEYRLEGSAEDKSFLSTPAHMDTFDSDHGVALVGHGYFGWEWVDTIKPVSAEIDREPSLNTQ